MLLKSPKFGQKSIFVFKNRNFGQKSKFSVKKWILAEEKISTDEKMLNIPGRWWYLGQEHFGDELTSFPFLLEFAID